MNFLVSLTTLSLVEIDGNPIKHECPYSLFYEHDMVANYGNGPVSRGNITAMSQTSFRINAYWNCVVA